MRAFNLDFVPPDLDFVPPGLEFVPGGLDFVPKNLDFQVRRKEIGVGRSGADAIHASRAMNPAVRARFELPTPTAPHEIRT